ncbi:D-alanyl-D-alanine carboxypeptidase family protein [Bacillus sp. FJAT-45350]|uniref:D-alanyl-D-alanine carboxypeptidase family protein n=1 Tax=Bacillus sp. FJAT-45350 TaxID=2011014 RepID=UPI0015CBC61A|nr:D-alanyl-D-alanine carboxypeptidase family protein [Bacillus sp. FJAT-45350]
MRKLWASLFTLMFIFTLVVPTVGATEGVQLAPDASSAILMERDTGTILFEKNSDEPLPPASMTKIMTMLLIMEAIDNEQLKWDDKVRTSERAASMGGSQVFLEPGEEMTVSDMLKAIAVASGNDASVAMAEHIAGSEEEFVRMMNEKAEELGATNTNFLNSNGLPAENHYTTAKDLALISKELLKYEEITKFTGIYEDYLRQGTEDEFWLVNTNKLVRFYPGVDGLKTGFTSEAKYCLTATAAKNDMRVISVIMGAPTPKKRNSQITEMLDYAFSQYMTHSLYERHQEIAEVKVSKGEKKIVAAVTSEPVSILTKKGQKIDDATKKVELKEDLKAPIKKGEPIGSLVIEKEGKVLSETTLVASEDVEAATWWQLFKRTFGKVAGN